MYETVAATGIIKSWHGIDVDIRTTCSAATTDTSIVKAPTVMEMTFW
jgi:hypothetical protein